MNDTFMVLRPFKYNGRDYEIGDEWTPKGFTTDDAIIGQGKLVTLKRSDEELQSRRDARIKAAQRSYAAMGGDISKGALSEDTFLLLAGAGYDTMEKIKEQHEKDPQEFLSIKGIGPKKLATISTALSEA